MYCCQTEMRCSRNGVRLVFLDAEGQPWRIRHGDEYACRVCERRVVAGLASHAVAELGRDGREQFDRYLTSDMGRDIPIPEAK